MTHSKAWASLTISQRDVVLATARGNLDRQAGPVSVALLAIAPADRDLRAAMVAVDAARLAAADAERALDKVVLSRLEGDIRRALAPTPSQAQAPSSTSTPDPSASANKPKDAGPYLGNWVDTISQAGSIRPRNVHVWKHTRSDGIICRSEGEKFTSSWPIHDLRDAYRSDDSGYANPFAKRALQLLVETGYLASGQ